MKARQKRKDLMKLFIVSIVIAGLILAIDTIVSNRTSNYRQEILSTIVFGFIGLSPFAYGAIKSLKQKDSNWLVINCLLAILIIGGIIWISLIIYSFKDFQLNLNY